MLVDDARQLAQPRRLAAGRNESLCLHAGADATAGPTSGVRPSAQNESSTAGPIPSANTTVPIPTVPPRTNPTTSDSDLDPRPRDADPHPESPGRDEHQRVSRPGAHRRSDVEGRADAEAEQRNSPPDEIRTPRLSSESALTGSSAVRAITNVPTSSAFSRVPSPIVRTKPPDEREHEHRHDDVGDTEGDTQLLREALVQHVPRRQAELRLEEADDPHGAEEEPEHEPGEPRHRSRREGQGCARIPGN